MNMYVFYPKKISGSCTELVNKENKRLVHFISVLLNIVIN